MKYKISENFLDICEGIYLLDNKGFIGLEKIVFLLVDKGGEKDIVESVLYKKYYILVYIGYFSYLLGRNKILIDFNFYK